MHSLEKHKDYFTNIARTFAAFVIGGFLFTSCATTSTSEPDPVRPAETTKAEAEFYTPAPGGNADDYWLFYEDEDDTEYSYYIDEEHYVYVAGDEDDGDDDEGKKKWKKRYKKGHGHGDYNRIHHHLKKKQKAHQHISVKVRHWSDSLQLTADQKRSIDTAMIEFKACSKATLDSFKVLYKPARDSFRVEKQAIIQQYKTSAITRDSAYVLLDSAIERYEATTKLLREGLVAEMKGCLAELDAFMITRLTPLQYAIWQRNRGW